MYTNVRAQEGGVEGRAYHLNQGSIPKFLEEPAVQSLLAEAGTGQLGKLGVDFKIDSIDVLKQTHSSWCGLALFAPHPSTTPSTPTTHNHLI